MRSVVEFLDANYVEPVKSEILEHHEVPVIRKIFVFKAFLHVKKTATGPDDLPFWFWKEYALELTPAITHILNVSLVTQQVPITWKTANVHPIPKETNISTLDQLRPISVTDVIMKLFERLVLDNLFLPLFILINSLTRNIAKLKLLCYIIGTFG